MIKEVAVVGASVSGVHFAKALRKAGYDGAIRLIGAEPDLPYDRPPLSKEFLQQKTGRKEILLAPEAFYEENRIDLLLGTRATQIDDRRVTLSDGRTLYFDRLFAATGSSPVHLSLPGADLPGVHCLRTVSDSEQLRDELATASRAVIIGGGFIGAEVAAACRAQGLDTTIVDALPLPFERIFGRSVAQALIGLQEEHGVRTRLGVGVAALIGPKRVERVELSDGSSLPADLVVVGVGARPNVDLFHASGIAAENGVLVDARLQTSMEGVYAGGDCARFHYRGRTIRIEHWDSARSTGEHAALTALGSAEEFLPSPFFWTDQYDKTVQYFGHHDRSDDVVIRGDISALQFAAFYLENGRVCAACTSGRPREALAVRRLVERQAEVMPHVLQDVETNLRQLLQESSH